MLKIGIIGHFAKGLNAADGQTIKTRMLEDELNLVLENKAISVDTCNWKKNPFKLLFHCVRLLQTCNHIVVLPDTNGIRVLVPLMIALNSLFRRKIHYVVIGGWLPDFLKDHSSYRAVVKKINSIHVESHTMINKLMDLGFRQAHYMPNFKRLKPLSEEELTLNQQMPYKLCTFSRVLKEKGIETAIEAVTQINEKHGKTVYTLDIYGLIDPEYKDRFSHVMSTAKEYVSYKGIVGYDQSVETLKEYFMLLFPTYYSSEGFAGTLLDAFASGLPVLASDWKYNREIVTDGVNGLTYDMENESLQAKLEVILEDPDAINNLKGKCLEEYDKYNPDYVIRQFLSVIEDKHASFLYSS
ncbi:glycosyltransferase family 4 protein [Paenibacillus sp. GCM10012303]|uniref:glycosyltransferase family 4 protein n=1 Tax=Paenibacillus sp. GCM10012303 TaxID=3317340 RepID=UPI00361FC59B